MFKEKSRFSSLIEEKPKKIQQPIETKKESIRDNYPFKRNYYNINHEREKKEILKQNVLSIENFPVLANIKKSVVENKMNFIEKIEKQNSIEETKTEKTILKHGWSEIKLNKKTNQVTIFCNMQKKIHIKDESELVYDVLNNLVYLYEKRKDEYIEKWGYDEWEHNFQFSNYDYCYFDKLDEIYEENNENNDFYLDDEEDY